MTEEQIVKSESEKVHDEHEVADVPEKKTRELNKMTLKAKLHFNVNSFKAWMKQKLRNDNKFFANAAGELGLPKFMGSHIALTAFNEKLCYMILDKVMSRLEKDKTGLYNIKYVDLADAIKIDNEMRVNLYQYLDVYDKTLDYRDQYCIDEKLIRKYIDTTFGTCINITNDAFNLLVYILLKSCVRLIDTAFEMIKYANRRSLNPKVILGAVSIHFNGSFERLLRMRIDDAIKECGKEMDTKEDVDENAEKEIAKKEELANDDDDDDKVDVKKKNNKKDVNTKEKPTNENNVKDDIKKKITKKTESSHQKKPSNKGKKNEKK